MSITIEELKDAFHKLLSYIYFDKNDLKLRHEIASFVKLLSNTVDEDRIFNELCEVANDKRPDILESWLSKVELRFYPKKTRSSIFQKDDHIVTNIPQGHSVVERLLVKSYFPVQLMILDTAWLLKYGPSIDHILNPDCYGNRLDLTLLGNRVRFGNTIFKKYIHQYQTWWKNGIKAVNNIVNKGENASIINFDISNCYHSIDFDFNIFLTDFLKANPNSDISEASLTKVVRLIYKKYWELVNQSDAQPFSGRNRQKRTLPLSLLSAHILANWYISPLDDYLRESYSNIRYYGRYVDDCMIVAPSNINPQNLVKCINKIFPGMIIKEGKELVFGFARNTKIPSLQRLSNFSLQADKLYIYHFDCQLPQAHIEQFENEQRERSSEFRFLTDEADGDNRERLEFVTLIESFDAQEEGTGRFKILEENKYKLSVFFAKLNQRLAKFGNNYEYITEVEKVFKYFHGHILIKHYALWEKMLTTFVLAGKTTYANTFCRHITREIKLLDVDELIFSKDKNAGLNNIQQSLLSHLQESYLMAMSLHKQNRSIDTIYLDTFMVRAYFNQYPLQEFTHNYTKEGVRLSMKQLKYNKGKFRYRWMPYYVKFYDIVCALILGKVFSPKIYEAAYKIYKTLNRNVQYEDEWKVFMHKGRNKDEWEFNTSYTELRPPKELTVSAVEMDLDENLLGDTIENFGTINYSKVNLMQTILDKITSIKNTDIFIMPELTLPIYELHEFCQYSSKHNTAFIAGMEYIVLNKKVYNYIITCLPIRLYGQNDAVPIIRLKNYYAPSEYDLIEKLHLNIPKNNKNWKILYHWKGHVFTNFYCFELTSIKDRAYFLSIIDALYCPVLNHDTPYFNNIAESCSRDLHCYFIMSNISQYGDSRVTQPTSSATMNIMRVKGGNTDDNKAVVLSTKLDINRLRLFQKMSRPNQQINKEFKFTPPDFDKSYVDKRQQRFIFATNGIFDKDFEMFIANMYLERMKPII